MACGPTPDVVVPALIRLRQYLLASEHSMPDVTLKAVSQLDPAELAAWDALQRSNPALESPYFRPEFARAVAAVRPDVEVGVLERDGVLRGFFPFQRGPWNMGRPVGGRLSDFHGPIVDATTRFDLKRIVRRCRLACWDFDHLVAPDAGEAALGLANDDSQASPPALRAGNAPTVTGVQCWEASPLLDLGRGYEAYCRERKASGSEIVPKTLSRERKLLREIGPVELDFDATGDRQAFDDLVAWKSRQFARTGLTDIFQFGWTGRLLRQLLETPATPAFATQLSVLRQAGRPIAAALWLRSFAVGHLWFIGYDQDLATYSPGSIMLLKLAQAAADAGVARLHLGTGDQRFKRSLASGEVSVGQGSVELVHPAVVARRLWRAVRDGAGWFRRRAGSNEEGHPGAIGGPPWLASLRRWWAYG